jgi:hypothetical protein
MFYHNYIFDLSFTASLLSLVLFLLVFLFFLFLFFLLSSSIVYVVR